MISKNGRVIYPLKSLYNLYTQNNNHYPYLLTFSKETKNSWNDFSKIAKQQGRPVSE